MSQGRLSQIRRGVKGALWDSGWKKVIPAGILLVCLAWLAYKAYSSWETLKGFTWEIEYVWIVPSIVLFLLQTVVVIWGWRSILSRLAPKVPFRKHAKVYCSTLVARRVPAGLLWTLAGRGYLYSRMDIAFSASALAAFLEQAFVVLAGLPIAAPQIVNITSLDKRYAPAVTGLTLIVVAVLAQPNPLNRLRRLLEGKALATDLQYSDVLKWLATYAMVWMLSGAGLYITINLFHPLSLSHLPEMMSVWALASLISYLTLLTPSGLGVKEVSLTLLLGSYLPEPLPLVVAIAMRVLWTIYETVVGLTSLAL